ncbi:LOW QUALITY PROTEIN: zinc uptake regulation protein Zur [Vibrio sp. JCM 19053]|nr:LOW QUALITY PROTEIN: zinc uptake regulation protein Zur [Vibrio sp. JCM 19053]
MIALNSVPVVLVNLITYRAYTTLKVPYDECSLAMLPCSKEVVGKQMKPLDLYIALHMLQIMNVAYYSHWISSRDMRKLKTVDDVMKQVEKICLLRGKQLTTKRKLILTSLLYAEKPLSAYELVDYCNHNFSQNIQAMSVYRILDFLEAEHFVHKLNTSSKYVVCSQIACDQEHGVPQFLICSQCGKVSEIAVEANVISSVCAKAIQEGFTVLSPQFEISCVCDECANRPL